MNLRMPLPKRLASATCFFVLGAALSTAVWIQGNHDFALIMGAAYLVAAGIAYVASGGSGDIAAIMRVDGDERQRSIDHEAIRYAAYAMGAAALIGAVVQTAQGHDPSAFGWVLTVGGSAYSVALGVLKHRR